MQRTLAIFTTLLLSFCCASPAGVYVGKNGEVGASWGGYSASAGLGGLVTGNGAKGGLHAEAATPQHFAGAGLGGSTSGGGNQGGLYSVAGTHPAPSGSFSSSSASSSASSGTGISNGAVIGGNKVPQKSFFDDIFNIPISVLGAVNQYLNNKQAVAVASGQVHHRPGHPKHVQPLPVAPVEHVGYVAPVEHVAHVAPPPSTAFSSSSSSASASVGSGPVIDNHIPPGGKRRPNYDDIFNIPISVLGAVNKLLNNGK